MSVAPHPGLKQINRSVTYVTAAGKQRPAIITALGAGDLVDLRVGHHGETYASVPLMTAVTDVSCWYGTSRRHF